MAIDRSFLEELRLRVDLVDLVGSRIPLRRSGQEFVARCPFHEEKTPSFFVSPTKQVYYCFGCGARGDAISFLMHYDRLSFREAVETLARQCGLELPQENDDPEAKRRRRLVEKLFELNRQVARFYFQQLREEKGQLARDYLRSRGVGQEVAGRFGLGYAPPGWRLADFFDLELLALAGLVTNDRRRDRFRDRLIFPIRDRRGRVVGFGSRALGEEKPKYLNSPETPIFQKRRQLYGLYELLQTQRPKEIIVVEGYFDVLSLVQGGIPNVVATLGTALSEEHFALLFQCCDEILFCFDGDAAGFRAAWRALETALPFLKDGRTVRFLLLPAGQDPDALVQKEGAEAFRRRLAQSLPLSEFFFRFLSRDLDLGVAEGRARLAARAKPLLRKLPPGTLRELLWQSLQAILRGKAAVDSLAPPPIQPSLLRWLVALLLRFPGLEALATSAPEPLREVVRLRRAGLDQEALLARLRQRYPDLGHLSSEMEAVSVDEAQARALFESALKKVRGQRLESVAT